MVHLPNQSLGHDGICKDLSDPISVKVFQKKNAARSYHRHFFLGIALFRFTCDKNRRASRDPGDLPEPPKDLPRTSGDPKAYCLRRLMLKLRITEHSLASSICSLFLALSLENPSPGLGPVHPGTPTLKEENGFPIHRRLLPCSS